MIGLLSVPKLLATMALGMVVAGVPAYFQGKAHQRQAMAVEALESSVNILRKKGAIDNEVSSASAADLCGSTGCQTTKSASVCDGFKPLRPKLETTVYILQNDRPFGNDVAAHNRLMKSLNCGGA